MTSPVGNQVFGVQGGRARMNLMSHNDDGDDPVHRAYTRLAAADGVRPWPAWQDLSPADQRTFAATFQAWLDACRATLPEEA
jgi:hypothetical protein